jgi:uncharacterized protein YecE (DUF72 family)
MIRVGIGGWSYPPWRGTFYPDGLTQVRELAFASQHLTSIEINGTFYRTQKPDSFRRWAQETPDNFVFAVKAPRYATNRPHLAEAEASIQRFFASGVAELGSKLGPVLWQLPPTKAFDEDDLTGFLALLPGATAGCPLRHVLEVRHDSFRTPRLPALLRRFGVAVVFTDSPKYPSIADVTAGFVYARLQRAAPTEPCGYTLAELDAWAARLRTWASGGEPDDLPRLDPAGAGYEAGAEVQPRQCYVYMINGAKERAPAAAMALIERLGCVG